MTVFLGIDFFRPSDFAQPAPPAGVETYEHEDGHLYVVVQPLIVDMAASGVGLTLGEYFQFTASSLNGRLRLASDSAIGALSPEERGAMVPVPFPPGVTLELGLAWRFEENGAETPWSEPDGVRTIGLLDHEGQRVTDPLVAPRADWPFIADANFARPTVTVSDHLSSAQREEALTWACAAVSDLCARKAKGDEPAGAEKRALEIFADGWDYDPSTLDPNTDDTPSVERIRSHLETAGTHTGGRPRYLAIYDLLLPEGASTRLAPPRFKYALEVLKRHDEVLVPERVDDDPGKPRVHGASYLHRLWATLRDMHGRSPGHVREALGRLYGFGERLRWPTALAGDLGTTTRFMVLNRRSGRKADGGPELFGTNAVSLAGQVFRVGVFPAGRTLHEVTRFHLEVNGQAPQDWNDAKARAELAAFVNSAARNAGRTFTATLSRDPTLGGGLVWYAPRILHARSDAVAAPAGSTVVQVPDAAFDLLEPAPRQTQTAGNRLIAFGPVRRGVFQAELHRPDAILGTATPLYRIGVSLTPLSRTGTGRKAYRLSLPADLHPVEAPFLRAWLTRILPGPTGPAAPADGAEGELWVAQEPPARAVVLPLAGQPARRGATVGDAVPEVFLFDEGGAIERALAGMPAPPSGEQQAAQVDLVFRGIALPAEPFNLMELADGAAGEPVLALAKALVSRVDQSVDRLVGPVEITYSPSPVPLPADDPPLAQLRDFNKLRIGLQRQGSPLWLTYPDALVPLAAAPDVEAHKAAPWAFARPPEAGGPHAGYWMEHLFTHQLRENDVGTEAGTGDRDEESERYARYLDPAATDPVTGYVEHQYSFRIPFRQVFSYPRGLASDVVSVADLAAQPKGEKSTGAAERLLPLLRYGVTSDGRALELTFQPDYLAQALAPPLTGSTEPPVTALRTLYEALSDLRAVLDEDEAQLALELWVFDGRHSVDATVPEERFPNLVRSMRRLTGATLALGASGHGATVRGVAASLLHPAFADFKRAAVAVRDDPGGARWPAVRIPFTDSAWSWETGAPPLGVARTANLIRVGLRLRRDAVRVIGLDADTAAFVPMAPDDAIRRRAGWPADESFGTLDGTAKAELKAYLSDRREAASRLWERFSWIHATDPSEQRAASAAVPPDGEPRATRFRRLFGELVPFVCAPPGGLPPVERVVDLFYIVHGFRPLAAHPALGDPNTSFDFLAYLLQLAQAVLDGEAAPPDIAFADPAGTAAADADTARERLVSVMPAVAAALVGFIAQVERRNGSRDGWSPAENALYDKVMALRDGLDALVGAGSGIALRERPAAVWKELFLRRPTLFATMRGIGLAIIDPNSFSPALHSLRITKRVRDTATAAGALDHEDTDSFSFAELRGGEQGTGTGTLRIAYAVDLLDSKTYDAEFQIEQNRYGENGRPLDDALHTDRLGEPRILGRNGIALSRRGGTEARSGEDVIEHQCRFGDTDPDVPRTIEANVVHYNPRWRRRPRRDVRVDAFQYLLPSRRHPVEPKLLNPEASDGGDPRRSPLVIGRGENPAKDDILRHRLDAVLADKESVSLGADSAAAERWSYVKDTRAITPAAEARDWHRIDTWVEHHYFAFELDETGSTGDVLLANDVFEVDVDVSDSPPDTAAPTPPHQIPDTPLAAWYRYRRDRELAEAGGGIKPKAPDPVPVGAAVDEIIAWLDQPNRLPACRNTPLLRVAAEEDMEPPADGTRSVFQRDDAGRWTLATRVVNGRAAGALGTVVACEVFERREDRLGAQRVLRVSVLGEPWSHRRVRLRILRNVRNTDRDPENDIDPMFVMRSGFSSWSTGRRLPLVLDLRHDLTTLLPPEQLHLTPTTHTLESWLAIPLDQPNPVGLGPVVRTAMAMTFEAGASRTAFSYWGSAAREAQYQVRGQLLQELRDRHPVVGVGGAVPEGRRGRDHTIARYILKPQTGATLDAFTEDIVKQHVPSVSLLLHAVWLNSRNEPLLDITWPILFRRQTGP